MDFDGDDLLASEPEGAAKVSEETFFGGKLTVVKSHTDNGLAVRFPEFVNVEDEPGVGLVALAADDPLPSPGRSAFGFGADILFDELEPPSDADNGDNVVQRGLASDPAQLKLQVDDGKPSCAVTGSAGRLLVKGDLLQAGTWYRISCLLNEEGLQMSVADIDAGDVSEFATAGSVGDVTFADDIPIALGRKAGPEGAGIKKQPDQFNGTMDSVWIGIDEE